MCKYCIFTGRYQTITWYKICKDYTGLALMVFCGRILLLHGPKFSISVSNCKPVLSCLVDHSVLFHEVVTM